MGFASNKWSLRAVTASIMRLLSKKRVFFAFLCVYCLFFGFKHTISFGAELSTAIVVSSEIKPYLQALEGIRSRLTSSPYIYHLEGNPKLVAKRISDSQHDVVFVIGPEAAGLLNQTNSGAARRIVLMVLDAYKITGSEPCGIDMRVPMAKQLEEIEKTLGKGRIVGILYSPNANETVVHEATEAASKLNMRLVGLPVSSSSDAVNVLKKARAQLDTLLFIPDPLVTGSETLVSYLVKEAFLSGLFVVGYNQFFLESGASIAFCLDYYKTGELAAKLAEETNKTCTLIAPPYEVKLNRKALDLIQRGF